MIIISIFGDNIPTLMFRLIHLSLVPILSINPVCV